MIIVIFLIAGGIQVLFLAILLVFFTKKQARWSAPIVPVSVVVCAHNEEKNLRKLIPLLLQQTHPVFEVIVVDDRSTDDTFNYLSRVRKEDSRLKIVQSKDKPKYVNSKKFALTLGIQVASYEWILLTDADCYPNTRQWIRTMNRCFVNKGDIVLGYSPYVKSKGLLNAFIRYEGLITAIQYIGSAFMGNPYMGVGRNLAYRKSLFIKKRGFDAIMRLTGGDDDLFINEHGYKKNVLWNIGSDAIMYSHPKTSWKELYFQKIRHFSVGKHYKMLDKTILGLFFCSTLLVWVCFIPSILFFTTWQSAIIGMFFVRWGLLICLVHIATHKLGTLFEIWKVPFLDFIFSFYNPIVGLVALQTKKVQWKKG